MKTQPHPSTMTDAKFIQMPDEWPLWPCLPLKHNRRSAFGKNGLGFIFNTKAPPYVVYVGTFMGRSDAKTWGDVVKGMPTETYASIEALLADWRID